MLEKINDKLYQYNADNGDVYDLWYGDRGVLASGAAWRLRVHHSGSAQHIATFTTISDGRGCEKEDYGGRLWKGINEILPVADEMIEKMLPKTNPSHRFYVIRDNKIEGSCATKENALDMIRAKQEQEKKLHQWLHAEFSIIEGGEQEYIKYA